MKRIYITTQNADIRVRKSQILVEHNGEVVKTFPGNRVEALSLYGNVQITTQAASHCLNQGTTIGLFTRRGKLWGTMQPVMAISSHSKQCQYEFLGNPLNRLELAKKHLIAKINNQIKLIDHFAGSGSDKCKAEFKQLQKSLTELKHCENSESLFGIEGAASAAYFKVLFNLIKFSGWTNGIRSRRPPRDPFNALLSFGYTLLTNEIISILHIAGLDPYLGSLHSPHQKKPALACDIVEEFRAFSVDHAILRIANQRILTPKHFSKNPQRFLQKSFSKIWRSAWIRAK